MMKEFQEDFGGFEDNELSLRDDRRRRLEHFALESIRRESVDAYNRLHSIVEDVSFVESVCDNYSSFPILPNLRCGAWYVDPAISHGKSAYFKSTDGHFGSWDFNLRRPNLHLLTLLAEYHGVILVDSTRSGKRMPDALSKTVPIWCSVINGALGRLYPSSVDWDTNLYTPRGSVSEQEHSQIQDRVNHWVERLLGSSYCLPHLMKPIRPLWVTPATTTFPSVSSSFYPVICISASHLVEEGLERRANAFVYVQGSGDDHELWSQGLTPALFWEHRDELLSAPHSDLDNIISTVVSVGIVSSQKTSGQPTPISRVDNKLLVTSLSELHNVENKEGLFRYVTINSGPNPQGVCPRGDPTSTLFLKELPGRKGEFHFRTVILPQALEFVKKHLYNDKAIYIACDTGNDISVGVAIAALQMFFDNEGRLVPLGNQRPISVDKQSIRTRLQWIIESRPQANPSRATLKRVNEFFLSPSKSDKNMQPRREGPSNGNA